MPAAALPRVLLHTIAIEPLRWRPGRVARPLAELLPAIALAGFTDLEIFAPHVEAIGYDNIGGVLAAHGLSGAVLSSYAKPPEFPRLATEVRAGGFEKVRVFPGMGQALSDARATAEFTDQVRGLADALPDVQVLLETHDNSFADDVGGFMEFTRAIDRENVGLVWQPTRFADAEARAQFLRQQDLIRHLHLQNRDAAGAFVGVFDGVVRWEQLLTERRVDVSIEFVANGMAAPEAFDLIATLREATTTARRVREIWRGPVS